MINVEHVGGRGGNKPWGRDLRVLTPGGSPGELNSPSGIPWDGMGPRCGHPTPPVWRVPAIGRERPQTLGSQADPEEGSEGPIGPPTEGGPLPGRPSFFAPRRCSSSPGAPALAGASVLSPQAPVVTTLQAPPDPGIRAARSRSASRDPSRHPVPTRSRRRKPAPVLRGPGGSRA